MEACHPTTVCPRNEKEEKLVHQHIWGNQSTNIFGETIGRLHLEKQNVEKMGGKKAKALRKAEAMEMQEERAAIDDELAEFQQTYGFSKE